MFTLPILPDELRVPLDSFESDGNVVCEYPGVTAVVRPLGIEDASRWNDAFPGEGSRSMAATALVFEQLIRIEGLMMAPVRKEGVELSAEELKPQPFDVANPLHKRSVPMPMRSAIYLALKGRATLSGEAEKNSDSPSASDGTSATESTAAEAAASPPGTS